MISLIFNIFLNICQVVCGYWLLAAVLNDWLGWKLPTIVKMKW